MRNITIIGASIAGCAMALYCARQGYSVTIFEKRPDLRKLPVDFGRSINMALMARGMNTLADLGLLNTVKKHAIPMRNRAIYDLKGELQLMPLGRNPDEHIYAVSRSLLTNDLLNAVSAEKNITLHFEHSLEDIDFEKRHLFFHDKHGAYVQHHAEVTIGADGVMSAVRRAMQDAGLANFQREKLSHGYKELMLPKQFAKDYHPESLLSWPRQDHMLLGNPNCDGSVTLTLFLAHDGKESFASISNPSQLTEFFQQHYPSVWPHIPELNNDFFQHPTGSLNTIQGGPWFYQDGFLLLGDAAHAIVPFFGQGMNSAFEDSFQFNQLLAKHKDDFTTLFEQFYQSRRPNTDAVAAMSMDNYLEIRDKVCNETFIARRQTEFELMRNYQEQYLTKHIMVMFYNYPYAFIRACGQLQDELFSNCGHSISLASVEPHLPAYFQAVEQLKHQYC